MGISREWWGLREGTPPNKKQEKYFSNKKQEKYFSSKKNTFQTRNKKNTIQARKKLFKQEKNYSSKKNTFQNKKNTFQSRRRLSIKWYLPIKCRSLQVVGVSVQGKGVVSDAEEPKGNGRRRWRGVGPAGRPSLFPFGVSVILKI
nr:MAG TPA: hypothetical protein [Caudoviricetes sp.]